MDQMLLAGLVADVVSYSSVIRACAKAGDVWKAEHWLEQARVMCREVWHLAAVPESCREAIQASAAAWRRARSAGEQRKKQRTLDQMFGT